MNKRYAPDEWPHALALLSEWLTDEELADRLQISAHVLPKWRQGKTAPHEYNRHDIVDLCNRILDLPQRLIMTVIGASQLCDTILECSDLQQAKARARTAKARLLDGHVNKLQPLIPDES